MISINNKGKEGLRNMSSRIEQKIDELASYIDNCKYKTFSADTILVNREEISELIDELKALTPDEIKKYQKIVTQKEEILENARQKAQELINDATIQTNQLISEHQIMQQAYAQANEVVELATKQAQEILDNATIEANSVKSAAMQYTDDILANLENIVNHTIQTANNDYGAIINDLSQIEGIVSSNRASLNQTDETVADATASNNSEQALDII